MSEQVPREPTDEELLRVFAQIPADSRLTMLSKAERSIRELLEFFPELLDVVYTTPQGLEEIELADRERIARLLKISLAMEGVDTLATREINPQKANVRRPAVRYPNRASWLKDRLRERAWNKHDLFRQGGPNHKTVQKILDGLHVREDVLERIAAALSKRNRPVALLDIPPD